MAALRACHVQVSQLRPVGAMTFRIARVLQVLRVLIGPLAAPAQLAHSSLLLGSGRVNCVKNQNTQRHLTQQHVPRARKVQWVL